MWYVYANCIQTKGTRGIDHPAWETMLRDFDMMAQGKGSDGQDLYIDSEGVSWGGILLFGEGDLEKIVVGWGCKHYQAVSECCPWCLANRSTRPYTDLSPEALWRPTEAMSNEVVLV